MQSLLVSHQLGDDSQLTALAVFKSLLADSLGSEAFGLTVRGQTEPEGRMKLVWMYFIPLPQKTCTLLQLLTW